MSVVPAPWRGRIKQIFWNRDQTFGYFECPEAEDDVYFSGQQLADALVLRQAGESFEHAFQQLDQLFKSGRFFDFSVQHNFRGVEAVPPVLLLPAEFAGRVELEAQSRLWAELWGRMCGEAREKKKRIKLKAILCQ